MLKLLKVAFLAFRICADTHCWISLCDQRAPRTPTVIEAGKLPFFIRRKMWLLQSDVMSITCSSLSKLSGGVAIEVANNCSAGMTFPPQCRGNIPREPGGVKGVRSNESTDG